jgi:hypothetical protein
MQLFRFVSSIKTVSGSDFGGFPTPFFIGDTALNCSFLR